MLCQQGGGAGVSSGSSDKIWALADAWCCLQLTPALPTLTSKVTTQLLSPKLLHTEEDSSLPAKHLLSVVVGVRLCMCAEGKQCTGICVSEWSTQFPLPESPEKRVGAETQRTTTSATSLWSHPQNYSKRQNSNQSLNCNFLGTVLESRPCPW